MRQSDGEAAIKAGPVIDLLRNALGEDAIPQILISIRQKTEREREITSLFRDGKAAEALEMKQQDGTAELGRRRAASDGAARGPAMARADRREPRRP